MRKAIALNVNLWIEGEDVPAHNFAEATKQAVSDIIAAGSSAHPEFSVTISGIAEKDDDD